MLAEDHDLPRETVAYLHALVGRAHNLIYRASGFNFRDWGRALFQTAPRRLRVGPGPAVAALVFWGAFLMAALAGGGAEISPPRRRRRRSSSKSTTMYSEPVDAVAARWTQAQRHGDGRLLHPA